MIEATSALSGLYQADVPKTTGSSELGKDSFLKLLTTQLQNQNPLEPMTNSDFIAQLATFSSLEQLTSIGTSIEAVYTGVAALNNASMASLLGTDVIARGDGFMFDGDTPVELAWSAPAESVGGLLTVYNDAGTVVWSGEAGVSGGEGSIVFAGKDFAGRDLPPGKYRFEVKGRDASGNTLDVEERIRGEITEMDYSTGTPLPSVGGVVVSLDAILTLTTGR
jgi:flagellar basal-body rod modification protein FlgD